jgi:multiple sugar transport system permease protein
MDPLHSAAVSGEGTLAQAAALRPSHYQVRGASIRRWLGRIGVTLFATLAVLGFLSPLILSLTVSIKSIEQISDPNAPVIASSPVTFSYNGQDLPLYEVPRNGQTEQLALLRDNLRKKTMTFVDPKNPDADPIIVQNVTKFQLNAVYQLDPQWHNYTDAWNDISFFRELLNTIALAGIETIGVLFSCTLVAYGFARFRFPYRNALFILVIATIFLPTFATMIPIFIIFTNVLHWNNTWLPLIVPSFFANAYDVFLLRQFLMTIPRDLDEAAALDGAGPFRTLVSVILPQAYPAIVAVAIFTFVYSWNDYFGPLIYLGNAQQLWPLSLGLATFHGQHNLQQPGEVQAATLMSIVVPLIFFLVFQRFFVRGIRITGVER